MLRDYQIEAVSAMRELLRQGRKRILLVSPTGSGKTTIAADGMIAPAVARGGKVLFLAHRRELIQQCSDRLRAAGVGHGILMSGVAPKPWKSVQVASIPTLSARLAKSSLPPANLIILDEAHHARASTYEKVLSRYDNVAVIGLSATPWRNDDMGLGEIFTDIVIAATPKSLIDRGFLSPFSGLAYDLPNMSAVTKKGNDWDQAGLEVVMREKKIIGNVVSQYLSHAKDHKAVVFAVSVKHSIEMIDRFVAAGVPAEHLDGDTASAERDRILHRLKTGETKVISNVGVLTEGFDAPTLELAILARPTMSAGLYLQMVGRVMRPSCLDCGNYAHPRSDKCVSCGSHRVKKTARIHDHAGCIMSHGLPDADRDYSLEFDATKRKKPSMPSLRTCKKCFAVFDSGIQKCPLCGYENEPIQRRVIEVDDQNVRSIPLSELPRFANATREQRKAHYHRLAAKAAELGHKPNAAAYKFRAIYGAWPDGEWRRQS